MRILIKCLLSISLSIVGAFLMILLLLLDYPELERDVSMLMLLQFVPFTAFFIYVSLEIITQIEVLKNILNFLTSFKMGLLFIGLFFLQWLSSQFLDFSNDFVIDLVLLTAFIPPIFLYVLLSQKWKLFRNGK